MPSKNKKIVIGFVGLPGAGKSTALESILKLGIIVTMGDVVRQETLNRGLNITSKTLGETAKTLRKEHGPQIIAKKCVELIKSKKSEVIFVDGLRSMSEVALFREEWEFPIIYIECDEKIRHNRLIQRKRADDSISFEEIFKRDMRELQFGVSDVIKNANYTINNDTDDPSYIQSETKKIIENIISEKF